MKVTSMTISNLYPYSYAKADFEDFNVFVGHNVIGKTNLVRILQILVKHPEDHDQANYMLFPLIL
jgi:predicted ATPase